MDANVWIASKVVYFSGHRTCIITMFVLDFSANSSKQRQ